MPGQVGLASPIRCRLVWCLYYGLYIQIIEWKNPLNSASRPSCLFNTDEPIRNRSERISVRISPQGSERKTAHIGRPSTQPTNFFMLGQSQPSSDRLLLFDYPLSRILHNLSYYIRMQNLPKYGIRFWMKFINVRPLLRCVRTVKVGVLRGCRCGCLHNVTVSAMFAGPLSSTS